MHVYIYISIYTHTWFYNSLYKKKKNSIDMSIFFFVTDEKRSRTLNAVDEKRRNGMKRKRVGQANEPSSTELVRHISFFFSLFFVQWCLFLRNRKNKNKIKMIARYWIVIYSITTCSYIYCISRFRLDNTTFVSVFFFHSDSSSPRKKNEMNTCYYVLCILLVKKVGEMYEVDQNINIAFLLIHFEDSFDMPVYKRASMKRLEMWTGGEKQAISVLFLVNRQVNKEKRSVKRILKA